jgi:hypothetical protein
MDNIEYTTEQRARALEAWKGIIGAAGVTLAEQWHDRRYGTFSEQHVDDVTDEWITALIDNDSLGTDDYNAVTVTLMSYSDYHGSDLDAANIRALEGTPGVTTCRSGQSATMQLGELPGDDTDSVDDGIERLEDIARTMVGLADNYPLIDDEIHSEYVDELATEAWEVYLAADIEGDLARVAIDGWEWTEGVQGELRTAYYGYEQNEWYCETATSVVNGAHDDAMAHAVRVVLGWNYPARERKRKAREEQERRDREAFSIAWRDYLTAHPLPYLTTWGREDGAYRIMRAAGQLPATVDTVRAMVREQAELAAYRDAEERATTS